ncbi:MAG TPA: hypothetical protein VMM12_03015 [Longimicrobiales bacterium]|nr:hypothetical protein [Longimicrobiales bacterium]
MGWRQRLQGLTRRFAMLRRGRRARADEFTGADHEPSYADFDEAVYAIPPGPPGTDGLRAVTRPMDRWFAFEVHHLEKEARAAGAEWAQAGLPRSDAQPEGELPPEQSLRRRASEIFTQWVQKVTTRVQDAIETKVQRTRQALNDMAFSLEEVRRARTETAAIDARAELLEAANRGRQSSFGFRSYWQWWWFVPAILLLIAVDWVANVPVFQELLPQDADVSGAWQVLAAEAETHGALAGLYRMGYRIALAPEVALLALGVIVFLVVLAHIFGESMRRIVAVSERDVPEAGRSVRQYRRQFWIPAAVGLIGGVAVVTFLFLARQEIATFAESRLTNVTEQIRTLDEQIAGATEAGNINEVARLSALRPALEDEQRTREERVNYADRIRATNVPIAILNGVLFLTAALLGYLKVRDEVTAADPQDPRLVDLMQRKRELRASVERHRERVREADRDAREGIAWAEFLAQSRPFEDWEGRRDRLARVTSMFRAENARLRGIDPQNIAAFRTEARFDVAVPEAHGRFRLPGDFGAVKERHLSLLQQWNRMEEPEAQREPDSGPAPAALRSPESGSQIDA